MSNKIFSILDTSPAAASTVVGTVVSGLGDFTYLRVDADLIGATGGSLNIYLQRLVSPGFWTDWMAFATLASGAAAIRQSYFVAPQTALTIATINLGTDGTPAVALTQGTQLGGHPGNTVRAVYVAGASTSAGAAVKIYITGIGAAR